jgi:hypothetical protein
MFKAEFGEIKEVVKDFRLAKELFKRQTVSPYVTPGLKGDTDVFSKLISFLVASKTGNVPQFNHQESSLG